MRTPVEVTDELFAHMKEHFSDKQLVEITALLTVINLDRFNAAFGMGSAGFSEGMVCVPPDRPAANPVAREDRLATSLTTRAASALLTRARYMDTCVATARASGRAPAVGPGMRGFRYPANVAKVQWFPSGSATVKSRDG